MCLDNLKTNQGSYFNLLNSAFWGWLSIESQPQNPELRINPEKFHIWQYHWHSYMIMTFLLSLMVKSDRRQGPWPHFFLTPLYSKSNQVTVRVVLCLWCCVFIQKIFMQTNRYAKSWLKITRGWWYFVSLTRVLNQIIFKIHFCTNHKWSHLMLSSAKMLHKPVWQTV